MRDFSVVQYFNNMAPYEQFTIALDDGKTFYQPGDEVKGRVFLRLSSSMTIKRVGVGFHGEGHVTHYRNRTHYDFSQPYFHYYAVVYDSNNESAHQQLRGNFHPGEFWFPFAFRLPPVNLPSSYHDSTGSVRYWLDSVIERPMWFNEKTAIAILVMEPVDVHSPLLQQPQSKQEEMSICCCCVKGGKVNVSGKINKAGYYPGEIIETKFFIENESNREVTYTEVILNQKITQKYAKGEFDQKDKTTTIASARGIGVPVGQVKEFNNFRLTIPNGLPPSTTLEDSIISVSYSVEMIAHVKGACVCAASIKIPVKIGFMSSPSGSVWSREVLQAIAQLVNSQLDQERQTRASQGESMGADNNAQHDDREMLVPPRRV